jgi:hypothetical protein
MQCVVIDGWRYIAVRVRGKKDLWNILLTSRLNNARVASGIQGKNAREALANWQLTLPGSQSVSPS